MTVNIENMRADLAIENKKFVLQALSVGATRVAAGAGLATLFLYLTGKIGSASGLRGCAFIQPADKPIG